MQFRDADGGTLDIPLVTKAKFILYPSMPVRTLFVAVLSCPETPVHFGVGCMQKA